MANIGSVYNQNYYFKEKANSEIAKKTIPKQKEDITEEEIYNLIKANSPKGSARRLLHQGLPLGGLVTSQKKGGDSYVHKSI